jgi:hypothetical protein
MIGSLDARAAKVAKAQASFDAKVAKDAKGSKVKPSFVQCPRSIRMPIVTEANLQIL